MENFYIHSLFIALLSSHARMQTKAQALCLSQFALANEACGFNWPGGPREVQSKSESEPKREPAPLRDSRDRHDRHGDRDHRRGDPEDSACCRRLSGIDNACVCQVLARLPAFISRPKHDLKLSPMEGCDVEFQCDGI